MYTKLTKKVIKEKIERSIKEEVSICDAESNNIPCMCIMINRKTSLYLNIYVEEDRYIVDVISGDEIGYGQWYDLDKEELFAWKEKLQHILNMEEVHVLT